MTRPSVLTILLVLAALLPVLRADDPTGRGLPQPLQRYFDQQVTFLEPQLEGEVKTKEDWLARKDEYRRQLAEMLGLDPLPPRTDLKAAKTGEFEHDGILVENLHYQSMPGLYVTANLYRPKKVDKPLPAILYVCGHSSMVKDGISYGNKAGYEHHGVWYAKHGFVCLVIDTVELGELHGEHHGTYSKGRWWWYSRGYTPAGVEAWAGIRGLDYLETRPEVDKTRFGVTGRSGGGAYSWWIAALDERIKAAVPTAGITTLRNYVVDGCVEGHCDCMFFVNTYRWDFDKVAALVAPRALCIANTDKDGIFPIDGVFHVYQGARRIYKLLGAEKNLGLQFADGPHQDSQPLNTGEFHWMTRFLQGAAPMSTLDAPAVKDLPMEKLKVFSEAPKDEINTRADEFFVPAAPAPKTPQSTEEWESLKGGWMKALKEKSFAGWPGEPEVERHHDGVVQASVFGGSLPSTSNHYHAGTHGEYLRNSDIALANSTETEGVTLATFRMEGVDRACSIYVARRQGLKFSDLDLVVLNVLDEAGWRDFVNEYSAGFPKVFEGRAAQPDAKAFDQEKKMFASFKWGMAYVCPRGVGDNAWLSSEPAPTGPAGAARLRKETQILRRFYLIGQTLDGQQVWDIRSAIRGLRAVKGMDHPKLWLQAERTQAGNALYASLFEDGIARVDLHHLAHSHMPSTGKTLPPTDPASQKADPEAPAPVYLNVLKYLDIPQAVAMACERTRVVLFDDDKGAWSYPKALSEKFEWGKDKKAGLQLRDVPKGE